MPIYSKPSETPEWASGQAVINAWEQSTAYSEGDSVTNNGAVFICTTAGTSDSTGTGPSAASSLSDIEDGTAVWRYSHPAYNAGPVAEPSSYQKSNGFQKGRELPTGVTNWLFWLLWKWTLYLQTLTQQPLTWAARHTFSQTITASNAAASAWASATTYAVDDVVTNDSGKQYICTTAGTSAGSGGPTGTGSAITDNEVTWKYLRSSAPAIEGTSTVSGKAGVRGVGTGTGTAPGLSTADVLQLEGLTADPSSPAEGQMWYRSDTHALKLRLNGSTVTVTTS